MAYMSPRLEKFLIENTLELVEIFDVMWVGWECDSSWYLCRNREGKHVVVTTEHGYPKIGSRAELINKIDEYKKILADTERILGALGE